MMFGRGLYGGGGCFGLGYFGISHILVMVGITLLVIALILWIVKKNKISTSDQALNTLKERFVQGEIGEDEYLKKKNILNDK